MHSVLLLVLASLMYRKNKSGARQNSRQLVPLKNDARANIWKVVYF